MDVDLLIIGLGYVGLPLAREAAFSGLRVVGYDLKLEVVTRLNAGLSHVGDISDEDLQGMLARGFRSYFQGVGMQRSEDQGYNRPDVYVIDDWR